MEQTKHEYLSWMVISFCCFCVLNCTIFIEPSLMVLFQCKHKQHKRLPLSFPCSHIMTLAVTNLKKNTQPANNVVSSKNSLEPHSKVSLRSECQTSLSFCFCISCNFNYQTNSSFCWMDFLIIWIASFIEL